MSDTAVHLVENVIPEVPVRQWVCSLPWRLRVLLGYDRKLCADVLEAFVVELSRALRRRAKKALELHARTRAHTGAVSVVQRGDSALRLNVHFHVHCVPKALRRPPWTPSTSWTPSTPVLVLDGVYVRGPEGRIGMPSGDPSISRFDFPLPSGLRARSWTPTPPIQPAQPAGARRRGSGFSLASRPDHGSNSLDAERAISKGRLRSMLRFLETQHTGGTFDRGAFADRPTAALWRRYA